MLNKIHFAVNHRIYSTCLALIFVYFVHFYRLRIYSTRGKTHNIKLEYLPCTKAVNSACDGQLCRRRLILQEQCTAIWLSVETTSSHIGNGRYFVALLERGTWVVTNFIGKAIFLSVQIVLNQFLCNNIIFICSFKSKQLSVNSYCDPVLRKFSDTKVVILFT